MFTSFMYEDIARKITFSNAAGQSLSNCIDYIKKWTCVKKMLKNSTCRCDAPSKRKNCVVKSKGEFLKSLAEMMIGEIH